MIFKIPISEFNFQFLKSQFSLLFIIIIIIILLLLLFYLFIFKILSSNNFQDSNFHNLIFKTPILK